MEGRLHKHMAKRIGMSGQIYGALTVLEYMEIGKNGARWDCLCECGNKKTVDGYLLRRGTVRTCGCGTGIKNDFVGKRFRKLLVLGKIGPSKNRSVIWKALCDCGNIIEISSKSLLSGKVKSCGCARRIKVGEASVNRKYKSYEDSAKTRGLGFELTKEEFVEITSLNCAYCGVAPGQISHRDFGNGNYIYNGIDRVDNSIGYIKENIVPCCFICNRAKGASSKEGFEEWMKGLIKHQTTQTK